MSKFTYLLVHKDHSMDPAGFNGGAEMATIFLARFLAKAGERVVVAAQLKGGEQIIAGVSYWDLGPDYNVSAALERAGTLGPYFLISAGRAVPLVLASRDPNCTGCMLITHDRSGDDTGLKVAIVSKLAQRIICVSQAQHDLLISQGADPARMLVLNNGVDLELYTPGDPLKRDYRKLVFAGALVRDKGIHFLIESFAQLKAKHPDITLDVYGTAALWGREEFFNPREIEAKLPGLKFHGSVEPRILAQAFKTAGVFVFPSIWFEPFGLTAADALAAGCPVVAFDVGGPRDIVIDNESGVLLKDISVPALTQALDALLSQPARLEALSRRIIERHRNRFDWRAVAEKIVGLAEELAAARAAGVSRSAGPGALTKGKVGYLSTWNQPCGLATYAQYMLSAFEKGSYIVLAEDAPLAPGKADEDFVVRCWKRGSRDFRQLLAAIEQHSIGVLHLNCHYRFFPQPDFSRFLETLKARGVKVLLQLHNPFTLDSSLQALVACADRTLVHTAENRLEVIANGGEPEKVSVLEHGVQVEKRLSDQERAALRQSLGMPAGAKVIVCAGFVQQHKGMEGLIEGVAHLRKRGIDACGYIAGGAMAGDSHSAQYLEKLKLIIQQLELQNHVHILDRFVSDEEVKACLQAADVVLMNYCSQYYEASGACSLAVGAGAVVAASIAPPFASFGDAVWHVTAGYPVALSLEILLTNDQVRRALKTSAENYCRKHSWPATAAKLNTIYNELGFSPGPTVEERKVERQTAIGRPFRVLVNSRSNMYSAPGGDTVLIEKTIEGLRKRGVEVTVDLEGRASPSDYDLVHLINFALPELTRQFAERARQAGIPYVVSTLCEDMPCFYSQFRAVAVALIEYVRRGQDRNWWRQNKVDISKVTPSAALDNHWTARHAAALLPNGENESAVLKRCYPDCGPVHEVRLGFEVGAKGDAALFEKEYGLRDFILCVGRLELRKNQLMLLKALEDCELPVVLAGGGVRSHPFEYEEAIRNFKRKGKTLILGRLSAAMLASAYEAARVHVLPSWYELPGLVSLEAACHNCNVVVTENGTASDYFGDLAFYCEPASERSIRNAVLAAYYSPLVPGLRAQIEKHTWDSSAAGILKVYEQILGRKHQGALKERNNMGTTAEVKPENIAAGTVSANAAPGAETQPVKTIDITAPAAAGAPSGRKFTAAATPSLEELVAEGENAGRQGRMAEAIEALKQAEQLNPYSVLVLRTRAILEFAANNSATSRIYFERALKVDQFDSRSLCGLAMCELQDQNRERAYQLLVTSLRYDPDQLPAINQLVRCAYDLNRFTDLENILKAYIAKNPDQPQMEFCLAGCLFKTSKLDEAERLADRILASHPEQSGVRELKELIIKQKPAAGAIDFSLINKSLEQLAAKSVSVPASPAQQAAEAKSPEVTVLQPYQTPPSNHEKALSEMEEHKRAGRYDEAAKGCAELLSSGLLTGHLLERTLVLKAELTAINGDFAAADTQFKSVLGANPRCVKAICGRGALAAHQGNWAEARRLFEEALQTQSGCDVALAGLGLCAAQSGDLAGAWEHFSQALKMNPENMRALLGIIDLGYRLKRLPELEQALLNYLEMHPADLDMLYSLAGCYFAQNRIDEARSELEKVILFKPEHKNALELRAIIDQRSGGASAMAPGAW